MPRKALIRNTHGRRTRACLFPAVALVAGIVASILFSTVAGRPSIGATPEDEIAASARAALDRMPAEECLGDIADKRLRRAVQATYRAVVELANNPKSGKVAALSLKFDRAFTNVERETASADHKKCAANCKALDGDQCLGNCKGSAKNRCACKLTVFACIVAECLF